VRRVRFALSEEATALRDAAREVLAPVTRDGAAGDAAAVWAKLAAAGVAGVLVPELDGGLGLDENALVPLLEEIGYSGLAVPAVETIAVAAPLMSRVPPTLVAAQDSPGALVPYWDVAPLLVLRKEKEFWLHQADTVRFEPCRSLGRPLARVIGVPAGGVRLGGNPDGVWRRGVLGTAAMLTGLARRMLDMTVAYVRQREQFGVPVGSFQAVKHKLADALVAVEFARPVVLAAGWAQAAGAADADTQTSAAKVLAADAARLTARTAIQCHGGMGYTTEYDLHLFAKQAWALVQAWGTPAWHRARLAEAMGLSDE
jgi:alkylation response protein AidB-like acyl-CoA dehydrogenase